MPPEQTPTRANISRLYPHLQATANVDWKNVDPRLLSTLNQIGAYTKKTITIYSGYRTDAYSQQVGGFRGDPHTRHIAVDARIGGKEIGLVIPASVFKKFGLITGNQPGFYHGKADPGHVQLGTEAAISSAPAAATYSPTPTDQTGTQTQTMPVPSLTQPSPDALETLPQPESPGMGGSSNFQPRQALDLWQTVNSVPNPSPDTQSYLKYAQQLSGLGANQG